MDDDIVKNFRRCSHEHTVEIEITRLGTAPPAGFLMSDGDSPVGDTYYICKVGNPFRYDLQCHVSESSYFVLRQRLSPGCVRFPLTHNLKMLSYPVLLRFRKCLYLPVGHAIWSTNPYLEVFRYLKAYGFPIASDNFIVICHIVYLLSMGMYSFGSTRLGYSGLIILYLFISSSIRCALQPTTRPMANIGVYSAYGILSILYSRPQ